MFVCVSARVCVGENWSHGRPFQERVLGCLLFVASLIIVHLLEQTYKGATVRLAPNDEKSATITFNIGIAQGSIMSP